MSGALGEFSGRLQCIIGSSNAASARGPGASGSFGGNSRPLWFAHGASNTAIFGMPFAAVLNEKRYEFVHPVELSSVDNKFPLLGALNQAGVDKLLQMEGQRRRWHTKLLANAASIHAVQTRLNQQTEYRQT